MVTYFEQRLDSTLVFPLCPYGALRKFINFTDLEANGLKQRAAVTAKAWRSSYVLDTLVVPFSPFYFGVLLLKLSGRKKGALIIQGSLGNLD